MIRRIVLGLLSLMLLPLLAQTALADNIDFACSTQASCNGTVTQSGSNFSSTGITLANTTGPYAEPFILAFDTATSTITLTEVGGAGDVLHGVINGFVSIGNTAIDVAMNAYWYGLPTTVQTFLGTATGTDDASVIYVKASGAATLVDVFITPTPGGVAVAEPASVLLAGIGLLALCGLTRRRVAQLV
jgi:hypothetical protein